MHFRHPATLFTSLVLVALSACSDMTRPSEPTSSSPSYSKGSGSGTTTPLLDVSGSWSGSYTWLVAVSGPPSGPVPPRPLFLTINESAAGVLSGTQCQSLGFGCIAIGGGKVGADGVVELAFSMFRFKGMPATVSCPTGGTALSMSGTFRFSEGSGVYSIDRCPR